MDNGAEGIQCNYPQGCNRFATHAPPASPAPVSDGFPLSVDAKGVGDGRADAGADRDAVSDIKGDIDGIGNVGTVASPGGGSDAGADTTLAASTAAGFGSGGSSTVTGDTVTSDVKEPGGGGIDGGVVDLGQATRCLEHAGPGWVEVVGEEGSTSGGAAGLKVGVGRVVVQQ